jgi:glutathione S-transferase
MPQKFTDDEAAQQAIKRFAVEAYRGLLGEIEALATRASPWLTGEQPGALDAYALTLLRWGGIAGIDPTGFAATWALAQRFAALPAVARVVERERLQLNRVQAGLSLSGLSLRCGSPRGRKADGGQQAAVDPPRGARRP